MDILLLELENMANNATAALTIDDITEDDAQRWQRLFGFSLTEARERIEHHRQDIGRERISDELWQIVKSGKEAEGHDRESYEFSLIHKPAKRTHLRHATNDTANTSYLLKLEGPLGNAQIIQTVARLRSAPVINIGYGESGTADFCTIDTSTRQRIVDWIAFTCPYFQPTMVRISKAAKDLSNLTMAPMLGLDTTLPHRRINDAGFVPIPAQNQYPVWYFFYGNLAKGHELQQRLGLAMLPEYASASVRGAQIKSWRGQYRALVDAADNYTEDGSAFLVQSQEQEDVLRFYETEKYEVVRCDIVMQDRIEKGLVFRFAGHEQELT